MVYIKSIIHIINSNIYPIYDTTWYIFSFLPGIIILLCSMYVIRMLRAVNRWQARYKKIATRNKKKREQKTEISIIYAMVVRTE